MPGQPISLDAAVDLTRTGDVWLFRGHSAADRTIQLVSNAPVNHVGMTVVIDDLPALLWHAELGRSLPDLWSGQSQRGVQLHDLRDAVRVWTDRYDQRAWLRQLEPAVTGDMEGAVLRTIARLDGTPFPSTAKLAARWLGGQVPVRQRSEASAETAYCAELLATTYREMGLLPGQVRPNAYDPGSFWSGDKLKLQRGFWLGHEITVDRPAPASASALVSDSRRKWPRPRRER